jgi:hypothetical protein
MHISIDTKVFDYNVISLWNLVRSHVLRHAGDAHLDTFNMCSNPPLNNENTQQHIKYRIIHICILHIIMNISIAKINIYVMYMHEL